MGVGIFSNSYMKYNDQSVNVCGLFLFIFKYIFCSPEVSLVKMRGVYRYALVLAHCIQG